MRRLRLLGLPGTVSRDGARKDRRELPDPDVCWKLDRELALSANSCQWRHRNDRLLPDARGFRCADHMGVPARKGIHPRLSAGLAVPLTRQLHGKQAVVLFFYHRITLTTAFF
jgi:hypothetical protein